MDPRLVGQYFFRLLSARQNSKQAFMYFVHRLAIEAADRFLSQSVVGHFQRCCRVLNFLTFTIYYSIVYLSYSPIVNYETRKVKSNSVKM